MKDEIIPLTEVMDEFHEQATRLEIDWDFLKDPNRHLGDPGQELLFT